MKKTFVNIPLGEVTGPRVRIPYVLVDWDNIAAGDTRPNLEPGDLVIEVRGGCVQDVYKVKDRRPE